MRARGGAPRLEARPLLDRPFGGGLLLAMGAAMTPVIFAYGGWHTASFVAGEMRNPERDLARGLVFGVVAVVAIYVAVNAVCLHVLGADGLAATPVPASADVEAANVMLTSGGVVKIVDFGLAKLSAGSQLTESRTSLGRAA